MEPEHARVKARTALLVSMNQEGHTALSVSPRHGPVFRLADSVARAIVQDVDGQSVRLGFPPQMSALVEAPWMSWDVGPDSLHLVSYVPGRSGACRVDVPLAPAHSARLKNIERDLVLGVLDIDESDDSYDIRPVNTLPRSKR